MTKVVPNSTIHNGADKPIVVAPDVPILPRRITTSREATAMTNRQIDQERQSSIKRLPAEWSAAVATIQNSKRAPPVSKGR